MDATARNNARDQMTTGLIDASDNIYDASRALASAKSSLMFCESVAENPPLLTIYGSGQPRTEISLAKKSEVEVCTETLRAAKVSLKVTIDKFDESMKTAKQDNWEGQIVATNFVNSLRHLI